MGSAHEARVGALYTTSSPAARGSSDRSSAGEEIIHGGGLIHRYFDNVPITIR